MAERFPRHLSRNLVLILVGTVVLTAIATVANAHQFSQNESATSSTAVSPVTLVSASVPLLSNATTASQAVSCPAGLFALGGGVAMTDANGKVLPGGGVVFGSYPTGNPPTGWAGSGSTTIRDIPASFMVIYATCAKPATFVNLPNVPNASPN